MAAATVEPTAMRVSFSGVDRATGANPHASPADLLGPEEKWMVDGLDWSWAFVVYGEHPDLNGIRVGSNGAVWSQKRIKAGKLVWRALSPTRNEKGYLFLSFYEGKTNGRSQYNRLLVHRMVLETFIGPSPGGLFACHWDGNPSHNSLYNLRWDTPKSNGEDMVRHGRTRAEEKNWKAKLTKSQAADIRRIKEEDPTICQAELAERFGVSGGAINFILRGQAWKSDESGYKPLPEYDPRFRPKLFSDSDIQTIFQLWKEGLSAKKISERFGVNYCSIESVIRRDNYKHVPIDESLLEAVRERKRHWAIHHTQLKSK